jgi:hypothetical protein
MEYLLLIYNPTDAVRDPAEHDAWMSFSQQLAESGAMVGGNGLQGLETATTVRVRDGETLITDGPFAETKEMLGGYYAVEVPDREAAIALAHRVPSAPYGSIEVRPIMVFDDAP